jgi:cytochrome c
MFARVLFATVMVAFLGNVGPVSATEKAPPPPRATYEQTKVFVDEAVAFFKKTAPEKAFAAFNDPKGRWVRNDLYVFAFDQKGVYMATGYRPERTGSNAWTMTDYAGLLVVQEIIRKANKDSSGLVDYLWKNPVTGKLENKTSYVVKVGDYILGAGFYHQ